MPKCRDISCVAGKWCLPWPVCSLDKILLAFALLHFVLQGQTCLILQASLDFLFLHSNPLWWRGHLFFGVSSRKSWRSSQNHSTSASSGSVFGNRLGLLWCWIICLEMNWDHSIGFKIAPKYCFWTLVDYEAYSISSKGFFPTVVDTMVIWIKFTHSCPF